MSMKITVIFELGGDVRASYSRLAASVLETLCHFVVTKDALVFLSISLFPFLFPSSSYFTFPPKFAVASPPWKQA